MPRMFELLEVDVQPRDSGLSKPDGTDDWNR